LRTQNKIIMEINRNTSVGEIVKANFKTAQIFDKHKIDFCCGGGISLNEACKKANIAAEQLVPELEALVKQTDPDSKYIDGLELDELCDYIEKRHHAYVYENMPFLQQKLEKLCQVHGENHPELFEVKALFDAAAGNLSVHLRKEELLLFPGIRHLVKYKKDGFPEQAPRAGLKAKIDELDDEHHTEGERFERLSLLTSNYTCPPDACSTYQVTYQTLKDFEDDLHRHIHLENNILFKKALILEKQLLNQ